MTGRLQPGRTGSERRRPPLRRPPTRRQLETIYRALLEAHGPQQWWPHADPAGDGALEICIGAILTQNTAWSGAAAAIERLRAAGALSLEALVELPPDALAELVRPSGYFNAKARKLQEFARVVLEQHGGSLAALLDGEPEQVRGRLLAIWGIGPETADAIVLYAARKPTFVVDAYAYRLFERLDMAPGERDYDVYRDYFLAKIGPDVRRLNEWHALMVRHGQQICRRSAPRCEQCTLLRRCPFGTRELGLAGARAANGRRPIAS